VLYWSSYQLQINPVHIVYPNDILTHPKLVIIFFHGIVSRKDIAKAWKETWTSTTHINGEEATFWIKEWLVKDMGENIQILSLSYDTSIYGVNGDVTDIGKNLVQSLVVNQRWNNALPNSNIWKFCLFKHVFNITFHTSMDFKFHTIFHY